jgi:ABC-type Mn2+/Zn2+ transport system ATPase subunit
MRAIMTELILSDIQVRYGAHRPVLDLHGEIRLPFAAMTALMGANGAGKSTLLRAILGWLPLSRGSISIDHQPLARRRIAFLSQQHLQAASIPLCVREVVEMGRYQHVGLWRGFSGLDHAAVDAALQELDLAAVQNDRFAELSGGQAQRVLLARALASGADILLLDEPFAGLDTSAVVRLAHAMQALAAAGRLVLVVAHELDLVRRYCAQVVVLMQGASTQGTPAAVLTAPVLSAAFGPEAAASAVATPEREP